MLHRKKRNLDSSESAVQQYSFSVQSPRHIDTESFAGILHQRKVHECVSHTSRPLAGGTYSPFEDEVAQVAIPSGLL